MNIFNHLSVDMHFQAGSILIHNANYSFIDLFNLSWRIFFNLIKIKFFSKLSF
jgi:hypothetical protein